MSGPTPNELVLQVGCLLLFVSHPVARGYICSCSELRGKSRSTWFQLSRCFDPLLLGWGV